MVKKQERFKIIEYENFKGGSYKFDRKIFKTVLYIIFGYLIIIGVLTGFDTERKLYVNCKGTTECINPVPLSEKYLKYCTGDWCTDEYLTPGFSYGEPPTKLNNSFFVVVFGSLVVAFILNHYKYNRGGKNIK